MPFILTVLQARPVLRSGLWQEPPQVAGPRLPWAGFALQPVQYLPAHSAATKCPSGPWELTPSLAVAPGSGWGAGAGRGALAALTLLAPAALLSLPHRLPATTNAAHGVVFSPEHSEREGTRLSPRYRFCCLFSAPTTSIQEQTQQQNRPATVIYTA